MTLDPGGLVTRGMMEKTPADRVQFLRAVMLHAAAALELLEGAREAAEDIYRVADVVVQMGSTRKS